MSAPGTVVAHIRSALPSLLPAEQAVARVFVERSADVVEMSSQQVADAAGASRATVVRTCQSLGYSGYQQLRVIMTRESVPAEAPESTADGPAGTIRSVFAQVASSLSSMTALLDNDQLDRVVDRIAAASSVVVIGNGLSAALASDTASRLASMGVRACAPVDAIEQQISARMLTPADVLLVVSGSGSSRASLRPARRARAAGAAVVLVTAFARSPIALEADDVLVVGMASSTFRDEVATTSRIPQVILLEGLVAAVYERLGAVAAAHRAANLEVIGDNLAD